MHPHLNCACSLDATRLENAVSVGVARRHSEGGVALVGGVGGQVLTQRHGLLQLGGDRRRRRARQSVTWRERRDQTSHGFICLLGVSRVCGLLTSHFVLLRVFMVISVKVHELAAWRQNNNKLTDTDSPQVLSPFIP